MICQSRVSNITLLANHKQYEKTDVALTLCELLP